MKLFYMKYKVAHLNRVHEIYEKFKNKISLLNLLKLNLKNCILILFLLFTGRKDGPAI